jgi:dihydrofolate synthase/folylpolyglutamate synthase
MNQPKTNDLQSQLAKLFGRINFERRSDLKPFDFKLDGIKQLLEILDQPHLKYPVVHVAGTKGKGSVSKMIGAVLSTAGYRTGVYTSPHLEAINQRISVNNQSISDEDLAATLEQLEPAVAKVDQLSELAGIRPLTFFEVITTAALLHFANAGCQAVVLEVGMGGRLDSTNVCQPDLCVITNINLDHTRQLGDTLEKIAAEKAGIIKPGVPVICGVTKKKPREVIHQIAESNQSEIWQLDADFTVTTDARDRGVCFDTWGRIEKESGPEWALDEVELSLLGKHQATNAAIAIAAIQRLVHDGWDIRNDDITSTLKQISIPGRAEIVHEDPPVVLDIAHNVVSIEALIQTLDEHFPKWKQAKRKRLILAISKDKNSRGILRWLVDCFDEIILTKYQTNPRGKEIADLTEEADIVREGLKTNTQIRSAETPAAAWDVIRDDLNQDDFVCITGSVFLVAELRPIVKA